MKVTAHTYYITLLLLVGLVTVGSLAIFGYDYYRTPLEERPFHPLYDQLKPTGTLGHTYGTVGSVMILGGVILYSSRKRMRVLSGVGKIKHFLEFHIFLCLLGAILVLFHTTFKFGGLVSVSFWSMTAVVLSGFVGRYLYVQIPRGIHGNELTHAEIAAENEKLGVELVTRFRVPQEVLVRIDALAGPGRASDQLSLLDAVMFLLLHDLTRRKRIRRITRYLKTSTAQPRIVRRLEELVRLRMALTRRLVFLEQCRRLFHHWHVVHLPFTIVMFVILFIHVGVAIAFGYGV